MDISDHYSPSTTAPADQTRSKKKARRRHRSKALAKINSVTPDDLIDSIEVEEAGSTSDRQIDSAGTEGSTSAGPSLLQASQIPNTDPVNSFSIGTSPPSASPSQVENIAPVNQTNQPTTSKYFPSPAFLSTATPSSSTTIDSRSRGKKRQRLDSEGSSMPSIAETPPKSSEGKKKRDRAEVSKQGSDRTMEDEVREVVKLRKKGRTSPVVVREGSVSRTSPDTSTSAAPVSPVQSTPSAIETPKSNGKLTNTTASQLADRARTMKDREELARLRLDQQNLDAKLSANKIRMEALEAELVEVKKEREGLKEQSLKEIGFKDDVIKTQDKFVDDLKQSLTCNVCLGMFDDPHTIAPCGHTSCAPCLLKWFESPNSLAHPNGATREGASLEGRRRACGTCRTSVLAKPMPAFVLNDLILSLKPRLRTSGETSTTEAEVATTDEAQEAIPGTDRNKMWDHIFGTDSLACFTKGYFVDQEDGGIARCRECGSEIYHDECTGCGAVFSDAPAGNLQDVSDLDMSDLGDLPSPPRYLRNFEGPRWLETAAVRGWDVDSGSDEASGSEMDDFIVSDGSVQRSPRRVRRLHLSDSNDDDDDDDDLRIISPPPRRRPPIEISDDEDSNQEDEDAPSVLPRRSVARTRSQVVSDSESDDEPVPYVLRRGGRLVSSPTYNPVQRDYPQPNPDGFWSDGEEGPAFSDAGGSVSHYIDGYDRDSDPEQGGWDSGSEGHISMDGSRAYGSDD